MKTCLIAILSLLLQMIFIPFAMAQDQQRIDSLQGALKHTGYDTARVNTLLQFASAFRSSKPQTAMLYANDALKMAKSLNDQKSISKCLNFIGLLYDDLGDFQNAHENYEQSIHIRLEINDKKGLASSYNNMGVLFLNYKNDVKSAMDYYFKALRIYEDIGDEKGLSKSYNNIGILYKKRGNYSKALEYYLKSQKILVLLKDKKAIARNLSNIGNIYYANTWFDKAIESYEKSLKIREELNDKAGIANCYNNIAAIHFKKENIKKALEYSFKSLHIYEEIGNPSAIARSLNNIGSLYQKSGNYAKAEEYSLKSLGIAVSNNNQEGVMDAYEALTNIYESQNKLRKALDAFRNYAMAKDSFAMAKNKANIATMEARHESEKKQKEIELLQKNRAIQDIKLNRNRLLIYAISSGFVLLFILALVILRGYRQKRRANRLLEMQNMEISHQRDQIEEKNKDITDSIEYARRIQDALLPPEEQIADFFSDFFILFMPKDIVSGDFYWVEKREGKVFMAVVDCTGHGVPGAFMSFLGYNYLNMAVREEALIHPAEILRSLDVSIRDSLHQQRSDNDVHDGMDIALCSLDTGRNILEFAGANNPLFYVTGRGDEKDLFEIKGDNRPIGGMQYAEGSAFENYEIALRPGDSFYVFSDGFADQFGGPEGKKFKKQQLKEFFLAHHSKPMNEQCKLLEKTFLEWKGKLDQVDDVCVMGVRI